jgi:hypothetical protein
VQTAYDNRRVGCGHDRHVGSASFRSGADDDDDDNEMAKPEGYAYFYGGYWCLTGRYNQWISPNGYCMHGAAIFDESASRWLLTPGDRLSRELCHPWRWNDVHPRSVRTARIWKFKWRESLRQFIDVKRLLPYVISVYGPWYLSGIASRTLEVSAWKSLTNTAYGQC